MSNFGETTLDQLGSFVMIFGKQNAQIQEPVQSKSHGDRMGMAPNPGYSFPNLWETAPRTLATFRASP